MMHAWAAFLLSCLLAQDPQQQLDELKKDLARLRQDLVDLKTQKEGLTRENLLLKRDIDGLRVLQEETAREVLTLRQALRASKPADGEQRPPPAQTEELIRAHIVYVDIKGGFVIIDKGERDGVRDGFRFELQRRIKRDPQRPELVDTQRLGTAEFEKYIGNSKAQSKLKILTGLDIRANDEATAVRRIEGTTPPDAPPDAATPGTFKIKASVGDAYMLNYGTRDGARQSDRVFVWKGGRQVAQLRIDAVDREYSIARLIDKTQVTPFAEGDEIKLKEDKGPLVGSVRINNARQGIMLEFAGKREVRVSMIFNVKRKDQKIGTVRVKNVLDYMAEVEVMEGTKIEDIQVGDTVEEQN